MVTKHILIEELEKTLSVKFENKSILETALTHSSFAYQKKNMQFNERLEFLGDSVLQLCISEFLFINYKDKPEGELTKARSLVVCENSLYEISKKWNLGKYIMMSKGEELTGGRNRVSILADCVEAVIAAIYLDQGFQVAQKCILNNFMETIEKAIKNEIILDYKTNLQEWLQQNGDISICYTLAKSEGPPHRRKFYIEVSIDGKIMGKGSGYSKKEAEQKSAKQALQNLGDLK